MNITKDSTKRVYNGRIQYYSAVKQGWSDNRGGMNSTAVKRNKYGLSYWRYGGALYYKVGSATCIRVSTHSVKGGGLILFSAVGKNKGKAYIATCYHDGDSGGHRIDLKGTKRAVFAEWNSLGFGRRKG